MQPLLPLGTPADQLPAVEYNPSPALPVHDVSHVDARADVPTAAPAITTTTGTSQRPVLILRTP
jgi:hypothetical protein